MNRHSGIAAVLLLVCACGGEVQDELPDPAGQASESAPERVDTAAHTAADFQALRYLEGDWRGSGSDGGPFYETYRFINDSTIEMTAWTDSAMTVAREQSEYMFRDHVISTSEGARLVRVDNEGHHFQAASYSWTFRRVTPDRWTARVGPSTVYTMDRITRH